MAQTFYITTPIYYANSLPHLGHLYTTIVADVLHRYKKQRGFEVFFLTGTDEHGINIQRAAEKAGKTPQEQVDFIAGELKRMFADFGLGPESGGYDIFMRTTEPFHYEGVRHLWREIAKNKTPKGNDTIYKGYYEGWFCPACAEFKTEGEFLEIISSEFENEIVELLAFLRDDEVGNEEKINRIKSLKKYQNQFGMTRKEFVDLDRRLPRRKTYDYNRDFDTNAIQPFFDVLESVEMELRQSDKSWSADAIEFFREQFEVARGQHRFGTKLCLVHERSLDQVAEESFFFRLSDYQEFLIDVIEGNPELVRPSARRNEVLSFVRSGLQDLSISRLRASVSWGIPVPHFIPDNENIFYPNHEEDNHVMYVWLDALSNYITALGYGASNRAEDLAHQLAAKDSQVVLSAIADGVPYRDIGFKYFWPAVHLVGKDILRFHTVYWFSFLKAAGLPLPKTVYAHGMWLDAEGRKMGKTLGNVIDVDLLHKHFQVDAVRYFCLREMVFGQDGKFGYENLIDRANADLASGLGNLLSRTISMLHKYRDGRVPNGKITEENYIHARRAGLDPDGGEIVHVLEHARDEFLRRFDNFEFSQGLEGVWAVIARIDKMISDAKPWELVKDERQAETLNAVLYRAAETLRWIGAMVYPVMPSSATRIYAQLGLGDDLSRLDPATLKWGGLEAGAAIGAAEGIFPRIDKSKIMSEIKESIPLEPPAPLLPEEGRPKAGVVGAAGGQSEPPVSADAKAEPDKFITIDDFIKVDLRVGEIKVAERVPNADKLLRFEVDLGEEKPRQILAGLAEYYDPEPLVGRKVVVVANLKPRKMRGLESQGMICAASLEDGTGEKPAIATFIEKVDIGARLK